MSDQPVLATLPVYRVDAETGERTTVGQVEYHEDGRLSVLDIEPEQDALLRDAVRSVNAKERILEHAPPGNDEPRSVDAKATGRTDEDFLPALSRYLQRYYGFALI